MAVRTIFPLLSCLAALLSCTGHGTEACPDVIAVEDRGGYECRLIEYRASSAPDAGIVRAYLLVPDSISVKKCPAVLMLHDHGARFDIGKEKLVSPVPGLPSRVIRSSRQWVGRYFDGAYMADTLASMGYVVLVPDALYWGDRCPEDARRWSELSFGDTGDAQDSRMKDSVKVLKKRVFDGQRQVYDSLMSRGTVWAEKILQEDKSAASLLASLPYVDKERIGVFGFSMGAHRCWLLSVFSTDVKCGAAVCWMMCKKDYDDSSVSDLSMRIPALRDRYDFPEVASMACPKPMLFINGEDDSLFPEHSAAQAFDMIDSVYARHGSEAFVKTMFVPGGHHCGAQVQDEVYRFFEEHL